MKTLSLVLLAAVGLLAAGCSTVNSRIQERPSVFANLDQPTQDKIKKGEVDLGYTPDMVYIALGNPDFRHQKLISNGVKMTWVYNRYYEDYVGTATHFERRVIFYPPTRSYIVVAEPVSADLYADQPEEAVRIEFTNGRVSAIEQGKDNT